MKGKLIVIEGTDCSGKETQAKLLVQKLKDIGKKATSLSFPMYDTPTGRIIAADILGKPAYGECTFPEGTTNIPPKVAALYYAADRLYNIGKINELLDSGVNVILDRYVESNMGHQGAKIDGKGEKIEMLLWLEQLEFNMLELPKPDKVIFLYLPHKYGEALRKNRTEKLDGAERDSEHLKNAEETYSLMAERYHFDVINCINNDEIKLAEDISEDIFEIVKSFIANSV